MFWQCILSPKKMFSFQTAFLLTLKDDCNKNSIFCVPSQFWPLKIKISPFFIFECGIVRFWSFKKYVSLGQNSDIYPSNLFQAVDDENRNRFFGANFHPLKFTSQLCPIHINKNSRKTTTLNYISLTSACVWQAKVGAQVFLVRKFLGALRNHKSAYKFLWCASPQIANPEIFFYSANFKYGHFSL